LAASEELGFAGMPICVVGGGTMGAGISHVLLAAGTKITLIEQNAEAAAGAQRRVADGLHAAKARGKLRQEVDDLLPNLQVTAEFEAAAGAVLIIETVPEVLSLKRTVLAALEKFAEPEAVIASNTSSLSINEMATSLARPERFLGVHFFNPVPASSLIEIIRGEATSDEALDLARRLGKLLDKQTIEVADSPGFATSRLGVLLGLEAIRMVQAGVASAEDIDLGMTLGYKHPIGPLRLTDLVGIDVRLAIAEDLSVRLGPRFEPPELMRQMVAEGKLGKKSGQGFYLWES
jgi:3-hydroxybutyryl-CoA dehydrogenase